MLKRVILGIIIFVPVIINMAYGQAEPKTAKLNKLGFGLRLNHLYDIQFTAYDKLANGFTGEDVSGLNGAKTNFDLAFGADVIYFFSPLVSADLAFDMGTMTGANTINYYQSDVSFLSLGLNYNLKGRNQKTPSRFVPFLRGSIANATYNTKLKFIEDNITFNNESGNALQVGLGAGLRYHITDNVHVNLQSEFITTYTDAWDGYNYGSGKDHMAKTALCVRYTFGKHKHQDRAIAWQFNKQMPDENNELVSKMLTSINDSLRVISNKLAQLHVDNLELQAKLNEDLDGDGVPNFKDLCPNEKGSLPNGCNELIEKVKDSTNIIKNETNTASAGNKVAEKPESTPQGKQLNGATKQELKNMLLIEINRIYFGFNSTYLNNKDKALLNRIASILKRNPHFKLTLSGFADQAGSKSANLRISQKRAAVVANYLAQCGVNKEHIKTVAAGKQKLTKAENTPQNNALNRRVEFVVEN